MIKKLALLLIYFYKFIISPILPKSCRYIPTCSEYAIECFKTHKPIKAAFLTCKRLLSCHPFSKKEMLDEVPPANKISPNRDNRNL